MKITKRQLVKLIKEQAKKPSSKEYTYYIQDFLLKEFLPYVQGHVLETSISDDPKRRGLVAIFFKPQTNEDTITSAVKKFFNSLIQDAGVLSVSGKRYNANNELYDDEWESKFKLNLLQRGSRF